MPRFYMNVREDGCVIRDVEGDEFSTAEQAIAHARETARDILDRPETYGEPVAWERRHFEIVDDAGAHVADVPFADAPSADDPASGRRGRRRAGRPRGEGRQARHIRA